MIGIPILAIILYYFLLLLDFLCFFIYLALIFRIYFLRKNLDSVYINSYLLKVSYFYVFFALFHIIIFGKDNLEMPYMFLHIVLIAIFRFFMFFNPKDKNEKFNLALFGISYMLSIPDYIEWFIK